MKINFTKQALLCLALLGAGSSSFAGVYSGGAGTALDPYLIGTTADLTELQNTPGDYVAGKNFKLIADIDMAGVTFNGIGTMTTPAVVFAGVFDGNNKVISNLTITDKDATAANGIAMFNNVNGGTIKNLGLVNVSAISPTYNNLGADKYTNERVADGASTIDNCYVNGGIIKGIYRVGAIVGWLKGTASVSNCWANTNNTGGGVNPSGVGQSWYHVGGIVGHNDGRPITNVAFYGTLTVIAPATQKGAILGNTGTYGTPAVPYPTNITNGYFISTAGDTRAYAGTYSKTDAELQVQSTYTGFDFGTKWYMDGYAKLRSFYNVAVVNVPTVSISAPANNSTYNRGASVTVQVTATPNTTSNSAIASVSISDGTSSYNMTNTSGSTYEYTFTASKTLYSFTVTATDAAAQYSTASLNLSMAAPVYAGGTGTALDPYQIATPSQLTDLSMYVAHWTNKHFVLTADIDMTGETFYPIGNNTTKISGSFNGQNHVVSNLTVEPRPGETSITGGGMFGVTNGFPISNLGMRRVNINCSTLERTGGIVGEMGGGSITNCFVIGGKVSGSGRTGGVIGYTPSGAVSNLFAAVEVSDSWGSKGGIIGQIGWNAAWATGSTMTDCVFYGTFSGNTGGNALVGSAQGVEGTYMPVPKDLYYISTCDKTDAFGTSLTPDEMRNQASFANLDFATPEWKVLSGGYAVLNGFSNALYDVTITPSATADGTISPATVQTVAFGTPKTFIATATTSGYVPSKWYKTIGGVTTEYWANANGQFSHEGVTSNQTLSVDFTLATAVKKETSKAPLVFAANSRINIQLSTKAVSSVEIYNLTGKMVESLKANSSNITSSNVFSKGIYIVRLNQAGISSTYKVVVE